MLADRGSRCPTWSVVVIEPRTAMLETELPGRTSPYAVSDVRPQINGILQSRLFKEGSKVKAGNLLYQIDPLPYQAAYDSAKAQLANARAALTTTKLKADRYRALRKDNAISEQDYDDAEAAYEQAQATVQQQAANTEAARINLGYTRITAPISGTIGRSLLTQGALVAANQTNALATIQTLDPILLLTSTSRAPNSSRRNAPHGRWTGGHQMRQRPHARR